MSKGHRSRYKRLRNETKETRPYAVLRDARLSDTKARIVLNKIRGVDATYALAQLKFSNRYASRVTWKLLKSAMANAENNLGLNPTQLYVAETYANRAGIAKRIQPRAKGRAYRIQKKSCHITIVLNEKLS
jgi:large subunit ribosomal protein L22